MVTPPSTDNHRSARSGRSTTSSRRRPLLRSSLRLIWNTFPRFISILLITVIGVAFFSGLRMTGDYLRANADVYLNSTNTMDINIVSTMGFSREDVQAIRATTGVESLYAGYSANLLVQVGDSLELSSQVLSLDPHSPALNQPDLQSGRLPAAVDECLVEAAFLRDSGKQLGDLVQFKSGDSTPLGDTLARDTYTIVGVVDSPLFLAKDRGSSDIGGGTNSYFFLLPATDFTQSVYTQIYVRVGAIAADDSRFTSAYSQAVNTVITALSSTGDRRSPLRLAEVRQSQQAELDTAQSEVDAGYQELQDAADQLADSRQRLDDGWQQLADSLPAIQSAEQQLATSRSSLNAGWSELAASRRQLDAGWAELASARQTLDAGWAAANAGQDQLSAGRQQLDAAAVDLANQRSQLEAAWQAGLISPEEYAAANSQIAAGEALYDQNLADWQANQAAWQQSVDQLQAGEATYNASRAQLQNGEASYQSGRNRLNNGEAAYQSGSTELRSAQDQYAAAEADLETGEQEYSDGLATYQAERDSNLPKLADAQQQIDDGIAALNSLEAPQWYVLGLTDNAGFRTFQNEAAQLDALAFIMPGFFFLIAALVSMTAMTRLVDSERGTIATFKALGYANSAIMWRYLFYALSATLLGSVIGVLLGYSILPPMIFDAFRTLFNIPHSVQPFSPGYALLSSLVAVVAAVVPALLIVWGTVRENPAQAMRPLAPKIGRRILLERFRPLWRRLSFLQKITARNLFRYKKRLLMTIFGVAGCTALIFTALGLHDALGTLTAKQFGQVFMSDVTIDFKLPEDESLSELTTQLDNAGVIRSYQPIYQRSMRISSPTLTKDITLVVAFQPEDLGQYIKLSPRQTGLTAPATVQLSDDGVILTEQIARQVGVSIGDTINLRTLEGHSASFTVSGIVENYAKHYVYMTPACYNQAFQTTVSPNRFFILLQNHTDRLPASLTEDPAVTAVGYIADLAKEVDSQLNVLNFVVVILVVSAAILIFVVLFSLTTINIEERRRELASLEVLGMTDWERAVYIYRENIILTLVGAPVGLGLGMLLQRYIITTLEIDMLMFSRDLLWPTFVISLALTFGFAALVNVLMYRSLTRIDMVESLKAVE